MASFEVAASIGALVVHAATVRGADAGALCRRASFDPKLAANPDARISFEQENALWEEAARLTGDDAFGLHAVELLQPGAFDVLDYAVRTAPTLGDSLQRLIRYNRIVHDSAQFSLVVRDAVARIEHAFRIDAPQSRHSAEFTIASLVVIGAQITEQPLVARGVEFRHGRPASVEEHRRIFGVEPRFARPVNALELERAALDRPVPRADPRLWRVIERHADSILASRPEPGLSTADRVRRLLSSTLGEGDATLAAVAARLKTSERTLQRKLADENIKFDVLLDDMRRDLALRYLADPKIAISEVAYLLGYSEPSPFHRAFKRWTGTTPSEARKRAA
jgi:AraC-like DNA-binding protein